MDEQPQQARPLVAITSEATPQVTVVGGGLAGVEAAWQLAVRGVRVRLLEMRPERMTPAHHGPGLAELVCSNSLKSDDPTSAAGCLKVELEALGSFVISAARATRVPAGGALAVDRESFSAAIQSALESLPNLEIVREECTQLPDGRVILATGPLTSEALEPVLAQLAGDCLAFFDAAAPIVDTETLDRSVIFPASRYDKGGGADYLNAPMDREQYESLVGELVSAKRVHEKEFGRRELFAACQPVEEIARTGTDSLRFGALKPVGLTDPRTGARPWAVVQLRPENAAATAYNLVGFQTNLTWPEQARIFRMIPGLEKADFLRYGVMHRNTFVDAPRVLDQTLAVQTLPRVRVAGQLSGTEGYLEAAASGLLAALNAFADLNDLEPAVLPSDTLFGALIAYATNPDTQPYQPMHVNYGIVPPLVTKVRGKRERYAAYANRATAALERWIAARPDLDIGNSAAARAEYLGDV